MDRPPLIVPTLCAGPFTLRPWRLTDLAVVREAGTDPYIPLVTTVPAASAGYDDEPDRAFVERQWARAADGTGYSFTVASRPDDRAVGFVGLFPQADGRASIGYWTAPSARGRAVAGHALRTVAAWALDDLGLARLELYIEPWNAASLRTAERTGFRHEGLLRSHRTVGDERRDMHLYALLPTDPREATPGPCEATDPREATPDRTATASPREDRSQD
ncbi:GNAT family N-acetyltransferase [Kitasatospora sp. NPDC058397]|uniref:GNAT family N-acetyltransferase n=1 Tax=unclassified Kitasatospora TaxID=2633591 RepID=UPI00364868CA